MHDMLLARCCAQLIAKKGHIVLAESCTGGGLAYAFTAMPGASACFEGGFVTYANAIKAAWLGVSEKALAEHGAVSEVVAEAMVAGALARTPTANMALSITGVAGPAGGSLAKPVGTVCFAINAFHRISNVTTCCFKGNRASIREQAIGFALQWIIATLTENHNQMGE